ncbi:MAG: zinc-dependent peptidase [Bacteroidota bacterium]
MFAAVLGVFLLAIAATIYLVFKEEPFTPWVLLPLLFSLACVYIFKAQLNKWWYRKFPPRMDPELVKVLNQYFPYFKRLNTKEKVRFEGRIERLKADKQYVTKELEIFPEDIKMLILANAAQVTFGREDFLLEHWDVFVLYRQAFHTPQIQEFHTGELHYEDGVVILAADPMIEGMLQPQRGYNMAIHQLAKAWQYEQKIKNEDFVHDEGSNSGNGENYLHKLAEVRGRSDAFEDQYGLFSEEDYFGVSVEHFFLMPEQFKQVLPKTFQALSEILNQDPRDKANPLIRKLEEV